MNLARPRPHPSPDLRCAYCHAPAPAIGVTRCTSCATLLHDECAELAGGCVTLGCTARVLALEGDLRASQRLWTPRHEHWRRIHDAVGSAVEVAITVCALFAPALVIGGLWWLVTSSVH